MKCKKFFALLLSLCMIFSTFVTVANAADPVTITVGSVEGEAGTTVKVPVSIANNTIGLCGLTLTFTYDPSVLTYTNVTQGDALRDTMALTKPGANVPQGTRTFCWDAMDSDYSNGTILELEFAVAEGVAAGDYAIDVSVDTMCDFDFNDVDNAVVNGKVTVPGDEPITPPAPSGVTTITVGTLDEEVAAGETFTLPVDISNNTVGLCGLTLTFTYDPAVFAYKNATQGDALKDTMALTKPGANVPQGTRTFCWDAMDADYSNGTILYLEFEVLAGAAGGEYDIEATVDTMCDFDFNDVDNAVVNGKITVEGPKTMTIEVGSASAVKPGETVTLPVTLSNNTVGLCGLTLTFDYDPAILEYTNATQGDALRETMALTKPGANVPQGSRTFCWDAMDADYSNGVILNLEFKVLEGAVGGDHVVDVTVDTACDFDFNDVDNIDIDGIVNVDAPMHEHDWGEGVVTTAPTCIAEGVKTYTCACTETKTETIPADPNAHAWNEGVVTTAPTHTAEGVKTYTCSLCGEDKTEAIDKLVDHEWDEGAITTPATCVAEGVKTFTCPCGETKTEAVAIDPNAHAWDEGAVTTAPTHTAEGEKTFTCTLGCGATYTEPVDKTPDHEWDEGVITTPATHTTEGVKTYTCACGETKTEAVAKLPDHIWDEGVITTAPTHITEGVKTFTCICGETKTEAVAKTPDHIWDEGVVTTPATHVSEGVKTYTCICGETYTETIPADADAHTYADEVTKAATCTEDGVKTFTCECGSTYTEVIPMLGHSYSAWAKVDDDNHEKVCATCGDVVTEAHAWDAGVITVKPTYGKDGVKTYTCPVCNGTKTEVLPQKAAVETDTSISAGSETVRAGQEIRIPVALSNNVGITGLQLGVEYDPNLLTLIGVERGTALAGLDFTEPGADKTEGSLVFIWDGLDADSTNGDILYLDFQVSNTAIGGDYAIDLFAIMACDDDALEVPVYVTDGGVDVIEYTHGDVDGDSEVDVQDIVFLRRHLATGYNVTITEEAGDVYKDGTLNVQDVVYLRRFVIGGYDIVLPVWP